MQGTPLVDDAGEGSEMENLSGGEIEDDAENDIHEVVRNRCRTPYLALQLSVFGTDGALRGVPCSAFERASTSIITRWFIRGTMKHDKLYRFGPLRGVIPYIM